MKTSLFSAVCLAAALAGAGPQPELVRPFESPSELVPEGKIDQLVFGKLKQLGIQPAPLCSDEVFLRRVYLDVIGTLPTLQEAQQFLQDRDPDKRRLLIDRLLDRPEYADYWAMKWCDLLRVKAEFPINLWPNAAQAYHRWIRTSIRDNMPYDRFVREMLTASGSNFRVPQVNFYRAVQSREPQAIAQAVALSFMGVRADKWPKERLLGMAAFFSRIGYKSTSEWKEEIVWFDPSKAGAPGEQAAAMFPDGTAVGLPAEKDPREVFADWLIRPENPWFTRNIANRVWSWLLGRGIIHEPDDIRPDNPPSNPELLAYLEKELVAAGYDLKHLYRLILNSKTYQLSSIPRSRQPEAASQFAYYPLRRLEAEVLIDALNQITGTTETYSSAVPEPFTYIPEDHRSIALPDGSITSSFLEMFGRPPRDTGLESERSNRPTADQRLHLLNSSHIQRKIENAPRLLALIQSGPSKAVPAKASARFTKGGKQAKPGRFSRSARASGVPDAQQIVNDLYLTILSRYPTQEELKTVGEYVQSASSRRNAAIDLAWALINSAEFLYRH
ncbi:MAG: DUF1549 and DUF1553 domain-containing protein [Thermoguttaceae bacterium]